MEKKSTDPRALRTRSMIQSAFRELVAERNFQKVTVQDVAAQAGVSRTAFYEHFSDKSALIADYAGEDFRDFLRARLPFFGVVSEEMLGILVRATCEYIEAMPMRLKLEDNEIGASTREALQLEIQKTLGLWLRRSLATSEERVQRWNVETLAGSWSILGAALQWQRDEPLADLEAYSKRVSALVYGGLGRSAGWAGRGKTQRAATAWRENGHMIAEGASPMLRVGNQPHTSIDILRQHGALDKRLLLAGVTTSWLNFLSGPKLLEALGAGQIDIGLTGDMAPILAQAAGVPLVYIAHLPTPQPWKVSLIVPRNSQIRSVKALAGKRVAFARGATTHRYLIQVLEQAGLTYGDIVPVYLSQAEAEAAFGRDDLDAWVASDPYFSRAAEAYGARSIADNSTAPPAPGYVVASRRIATQRPEMVRAFLEEWLTTGQWVARNETGVLPLLNGVGENRPGTSGQVLQGAGELQYRPMDRELVHRQQEEADALYRIGLLDTRVDIRHATLTPQQSARFAPDYDY